MSKKKKKGSALIITIVVGLIIVSLSGILLSTINNELLTKKSSEERTAAKYLAEAGIEHGLYLYSKYSEAEMLSGSPYAGNVGVSSETGSYQIVYQGGGKFLSTGITPENRIMKIYVELDSTGAIIKWEEVK